MTFVLSSFERNAICKISRSDNDSTIIYYYYYFIYHLRKLDISRT